MQISNIGASDSGYIPGDSVRARLVGSYTARDLLMQVKSLKIKEPTHDNRIGHDVITDRCPRRRIFWVIANASSFKRVHPIVPTNRDLMIGPRELIAPLLSQFQINPWHTAQSTIESGMLHCRLSDLD